MSIRMYPAWRVSRVRLNGFIDAIHDFMEAKVVEEWRSMMGLFDLKPSEVPVVEDVDPKLIEERERWEMARDYFKALAARDEFAFNDVECGLNMWMRGRYLYVTTYGALFSHGGFGEFKAPGYATDYSYFDHADKPNGVSKQAWRKRANVWKRVCLGSGKEGRNPRRLQHRVVDLSDGLRVEELWDLVKLPREKIGLM